MPKDIVYLWKTSFFLWYMSSSSSLDNSGAINLILPPLLLLRPAAHGSLLLKLAGTEIAEGKNDWSSWNQTPCSSEDTRNLLQLISPYLFVPCFVPKNHVTQLREHEKCTKIVFTHDITLYNVKEEEGRETWRTMWSSLENPRSNKQTYNFNTTVLSINCLCY